MSPQGKRLTMICASLVLLQIMFAVHRFAQGATALRAEGDGGALRAQILKKRGTPSRHFDKALRSGEISPPSDGTGGITLGDLSTQSFIEAVPL